MRYDESYLFNINASYDVGAYRKADFPVLSDLLAHMDRLGIDGAAVHSVMARDFQPAPGRHHSGECGARPSLRLLKYPMKKLRGRRDGDA